MGSCSRVKGCHGDSAAERGMVRLVEREIKAREWKRVKRGRRKKKGASGEVGACRTQLTVMVDQRHVAVTSHCLLSAPFSPGQDMIA